MGLAVESSVDDGVEAVIHQVIGCRIRVHRELGPGLLEGIYKRAVCLELEAEALPFELEKRVPVLYRQKLLCYQRLDLIVANQVLIEAKAVERLIPVHHAQVLCYLRVARLRVGLLMNFNVPVLPDGLRRIVL